VIDLDAIRNDVARFNSPFAGQVRELCAEVERLRSETAAARQVFETSFQAGMSQAAQVAKLKDLLGRTLVYVDPRADLNDEIVQALKDPS
jgi:hypothetical protein